MDERGPTGRDKPPDRQTNALDTEGRSAASWRGNRRAWYIGPAKGRYQSALSASTANSARLETLIAASKVELPALA